MASLRPESHRLEEACEPCPTTAARKDSCSSIVGESIDFDGESDPLDPMNWSAAYRWCLVVVISAISLSVNLAILMSAPAMPVILEEFESSDELEATFLVSIWELGEGIGPLILAPLSEIYGRLPVYHAANIIFVALSIGAARCGSLNMLIAYRFLLGLNVVSLTLNSCIVGDMFRPEQRGRALSVMGTLPYVAPCLGPSIGGYITKVLSWRWTFWLTAICTGFLELVLLVILRETYSPVILERKAKKYRLLLGNPKIRGRYTSIEGPHAALWRSVLRPIRLLFTSRVVLMVSVCGAFTMGYLYIVFTTLTPIFKNIYGFSEARVGLSYLGLGIGMTVGIITTGLFLDWQLKRQVAKGNAEPEVRLPPMVIGSILVPLGVLILGWLVQFHAHWILPILATSLVGAGFAGVTLSAWSYLVDAFGIYAASATAGAQILRSIASAALPLAGPALSERVGIGMGYTTLALISFIFVPLPIILIRYGKQLRSNGCNGLR